MAGEKSNDGLFKTGMVLVALLLTVILFIFAYSSVANTRFNCIQINQLKSGTREQILNSNARLPKIQYYKDHPDELAAARKVNNELLKIYQPGKCHGFFGR